MLASSRDRKEILYTAEEILSLNEAVDGKFSPRRVRELANGLNKLLIEGSYMRSWHRLELAGSPYLNANSLRILDLKAAGYPPEAYALQNRFVAVAAVFGATDTTTAWDINSYNPEHRYFDKSIVETVGNRFKVSKFLSASGMYAHGKEISRQAAIRFVRDKRGGAHRIDWKIDRDDVSKSYDILASIYDPTTLEVGKTISDYEMLRDGLNSVERYVIHIAGDFVYSEDTQNFLETIRERFPGELE